MSLWIGQGDAPGLLNRPDPVPFAFLTTKWVGTDRAVMDPGAVVATNWARSSVSGARAAVREDVRASAKAWLKGGHSQT